MGTVTAWLRQPFSEDMDVFHWALFILFVLVIVCFWGYTIKLVTAEL